MGAGFYPALFCVKDFNFNLCKAGSFPERIRYPITDRLVRCFGKATEAQFHCAQPAVNSSLNRPMNLL